jgi:gamma-glutamylcyclotransferase (GGCT)/AIG2-like uncharacterized protein YtfP
MLSFFFYGTLMDPDLRAAVLGGPSPFVHPGSLSDYRRAPIASQDYPGIAPSPGHVVEGLLVQNLTPEMAARASLYEGDQYEARLLSVQTEDGTEHSAWTYVSLPGLRLAAGDWCLDTWQRRRKALTVKAARSYMTRLPAAALRPHASAWSARL